MVDEKKLEKNRIVINISSSAVEVESSTESLDKVYDIAHQIAVNISKGQVSASTPEERLRDVGIN